MGTRWRSLLAPINHATGDGRRFLEFTNRDLPLPHRWQREDTEGHDKSVVVGLTDAMAYLSVRDGIDQGWLSQEVADKAKLDPDMMAVFGKGEFFNDVDATKMPRLAEDVAEAMLLAGSGVLGPSVGPGAVEFFGVVHPGTENLITFEEIMEAEDSGDMLDVEYLFSAYEIAESTLVPVPAFSETSAPFEILTDETAPADAVPEAAWVALVAAAAATAAPPVYPDAWFADPHLSEVTPITVTDGGRVFGHVAQWDVCHVGIPNVCATAPHSEAGYAYFHRYPADTISGETVAAGRLTTGHGRAGTSCACAGCRGKDDHACELLTLAQAIGHYDRLTTLGWVRAGEDAHGIWVAGALAASVDAADRHVLARRAVSGDWRDVAGRYELTEVLALARERPGFPLALNVPTRGRHALVAAGAVRPPPRAAGVPAPDLDYPRIGREVVDVLRAEGVIPPLLTAVTAAAEHTGAIVALRMTDDDAARLAVEGGEPADELHLTLAHLGEGADFDADARQAVIDALTGIAAAPVIGEPFSVSVFNPTSDDQDTAIVLGLSGDEIAAAYEATTAALSGFNLPEQHAPFVAHVTLIYSDDLDLVEELVDRTEQPVTFDRIRVAFAGEATDIPLGAVAEDAAEAAALAAEIDAAIDADTAAVRSREANHLLDEMMSEEGVRV